MGTQGKMNSQASRSVGTAGNIGLKDMCISQLTLSYAAVTNSPQISEAYDKCFFLLYITCLCGPATALLHVFFTLEPEHRGAHWVLKLPLIFYWSKQISWPNLTTMERLFLLQKGHPREG